MNQGSIVLIPFPFTNLRSKKVRPAIVVSNNSGNSSDFILCGITSQRPHKNFVNVNTKDLSIGSLPIDSYIKFDKVATLDKSIIRKTVGEVNFKKLSEVIQGIESVIEITSK